MDSLEAVEEAFPLSLSGEDDPSVFFQTAGDQLDENVKESKDPQVILKNNLNFI